MSEFEVLSAKEGKNPLGIASEVWQEAKQEVESLEWRKKKEKDALFLSGLGEEIMNKFSQGDARKAIEESIRKGGVYTNETDKIEEAEEELEKLPKLMKEKGIEVGRFQQQIDVIEGPQNKLSEEIDEIDKDLADLRAQELILQMEIDFKTRGFRLTSEKRTYPFPKRSYTEAQNELKEVMQKIQKNKEEKEKKDEELKKMKGDNASALEALITDRTPKVGEYQAYLAQRRTLREKISDLKNQREALVSSAAIEKILLVEMEVRRQISTALGASFAEIQEIERKGTFGPEETEHKLDVLKLKVEKYLQEVRKDPNKRDSSPDFFAQLEKSGNLSSLPQGGDEMGQLALMKEREFNSDGKPAGKDFYFDPRANNLVNFYRMAPGEIGRSISDADLKFVYDLLNSKKDIEEQFKNEEGTIDRMTGVSDEYKLAEHAKLNQKKDFVFALLHISRSIFEEMKLGNPASEALAKRFYWINSGRDPGEDHFLIAKIGIHEEEVKVFTPEEKSAALARSEMKERQEKLPPHFLDNYRELYLGEVEPLMKDIYNERGKVYFQASQQAEDIIAYWRGDFSLNDLKGEANKGKREELFRYLHNLVESPGERFNERTLKDINDKEGKTQKTPAAKLLFNLALQRIAEELRLKIVKDPDLVKDFEPFQKSKVENIGMLDLNQNLKIEDFGSITDGVTVAGSVLRGLGMYYAGLTAVVNLVIALQNYKNFADYLPHILAGAAGVYALTEYNYLLRTGDPVTNYIRYRVAADAHLKKLFIDFTGDEREVALMKMIDWKETRADKLVPRKDKNDKSTGPSTLSSQNLKDRVEAGDIQLLDQGESSKNEFYRLADSLTSGEGDSKNTRRYELYKELSGKHTADQMVNVIKLSQDLKMAQ
ncbi:hypothetical protein HZA38_05850 [Candidatus Peregrinibacteria bacterium]|nr:hypothetical protein [Candidatus Peregrinibacteria bacterium]